MTDKGNDVLTVRLIPKLVTVALRDDVNSRLRRLVAAVDFARAIFAKLSVFNAADEALWFDMFKHGKLPAAAI